MQKYDEFSTFTTTDEIYDFIDKLIEEGISEELDLYDKCVEEFGKYFTLHLNE